MKNPQRKVGKLIYCTIRCHFQQLLPYFDLSLFYYQNTPYFVALFLCSFKSYTYGNLHKSIWTMQFAHCNVHNAICTNPYPQSNCFETVCSKQFVQSTNKNKLCKTYFTNQIIHRNALKAFCTKPRVLRKSQEHFLQHCKINKLKYILYDYFH